RTSRPRSSTTARPCVPSCLVRWLQVSTRWNTALLEVTTTPCRAASASRCVEESRMFDLSAYALRFLEYMVLMVLFGVPLFGWYGLRRPALADALAGWPFMGILLVSAAVGLVLTGPDVVFKTAGIMGMPIADVDRESLGWYLF